MKYRKKPVEIEAVIFDGTNKSEIEKFVGRPLTEFASKNFKPQLEDVTKLAIPTLEGVMYANAGDFIIKGVKGEFYPCKPDIFAETYEEVV